MFFLEGEPEWKKHEASGAELLLEAISDEEYNAMRKAHRLQDGTVDLAAFVSEFCVRAVKDWKGIGDRKAGQLLPCNAENVARLGRLHCNTLGAWVIDAATGLHRFIEQETEAAKNA